MEQARKNATLRSLPSIDSLLLQPALAPLLAAHPRARKVAALRIAVDRVRARLLKGEDRGFEEADLVDAFKQLGTPGLRRVFNATGVVLHTNLGRAPLAPEAAERVRQVAAGYSNLEYNLDEGERGSRYAPLVSLLRDLTGAEDAVVVNNNAAAVLLALTALAQGREAIVSRGELVEIGGGFRIPDVMRQSGATLVEVGTTNRTHLADYEKAISPSTGLLLKVHKSNFAQIGFTEEVSSYALAALGRRTGIPVFEDLGSGALVTIEGEGISPEPTVSAVVASGVDLVAFSGDKLLGGPQAGILLGRADLVSRVKSHPLNRALRVDKMTVAALEATLELYRDGRVDEIPAHRLLKQRSEDLRARAVRLQALLQQRGVASQVQATEGQVGGGAMPLSTPRSFACAIETPSPDLLQERLRGTEPPVIARVSAERLLLDIRCLDEEDLDSVAAAVATVV
jgi:L-seryl-tRNA(Ser) seleniumtransferase